MSTTKTKVMTTQEVADRLVELCNEGQYDEAVTELYGEKVVAIEPEGSQPPTRKEGLKAVLEGQKAWNDAVEEFHGQKIGEPIVADDHFALTLYMEVSMKGIGRTAMNEIVVYKVKDGKIVQVQFFYTPPPMN